MAKIKSVYRCEQCGADHSKWAGQCSECGEWNCLTEVRLESVTPHRAKPKLGGYAEKSPLLPRSIKFRFRMYRVLPPVLVNLIGYLVAVWLRVRWF